MAARPYSDFVSLIAPSVPGCPNPTIQSYVARAAREVCERTLAYRYSHDEVTLTAADFSYTYAPPANTEVHGIISAKVNTARIVVLPYEQVQSKYPLWPSTDADQQGQPLYITQFSPTQYYLAPTPDAVETYDLNMVVALKPTISATGLEAEIANELETAIQHRALQHLLVLPEKPWSDRELAAYHARQYIFSVTERRARANVGPGGGVLTARGNSFS
jgi:hypothetical protein